MPDLSRRHFLGQLTAAAAMAALARGGVAATVNGNTPFHMLVLGDSLVWGQGLPTQDKFHFLISEWIRDDIWNGLGLVHVDVRSHSGATIELLDEEAEAYSRAELAETTIHPEINVSYPTIRDQLSAAKDHHVEAANVRLVLLSGGVPEVGVTNILDPFGSDKQLAADIERYCFQAMSRLLIKTAEAFPQAHVALVGYYPIITRHTPVKRIVNDVLEVYNWPGWAKPLINNPLNRVLWRRYRRKMIRRSDLWAKGSAAAFRRAVDRANNATGGDRSVFIEPPFAAANGYGARDTYLFTVGRKGKAADPMAAERAAECRPALDELRRATDLKYRTRVCELASIGHPNAAGSAAIARAIRETLGSRLKETVSNL
jgi:lysophospholipase L1-like esterase